MQEANTRIIELDHDDFESVDRMLSYFYGPDYDDRDWTFMEKFNDNMIMRPDAEVDLLSQEKVTFNTQGLPVQHKTYPDSNQTLEDSRLTARHIRMLNNIHVYAIAEKYDIPTLKSLAICKFEDLAVHFTLYPDFTSIIREVYESTPESDKGLRSIVIRLCIDNVEGFRTIAGRDAGELTDLPQALLDILAAHKEKADQDVEYECALKSKVEDELRDTCGVIGQLETDNTQLRMQLTSQNWTFDAIFKAAKTLQYCRQCAKPLYLRRDNSQAYLWAKFKCPKCGSSRPVPRP